jgi:hypothetical protein
MNPRAREPDRQSRGSMPKEKRKSRRRPLRYSAWMALDDEKLHGCVLSDISDTGARLDVEDSKMLPDRFRLLLSGASSTRRECRVIWRGPGQLGVAFEKRLTDASEVTLASEPNSQTSFAPEPAESA